MSEVQLEELFFVPPLAIARLGAADTPLEAFRWVASPDSRGAGRTVIRPDVTLTVRGDGKLSAYMPKRIVFREKGKLRPVAPFFELWARMKGEKEAQALTLDRLAKLGAKPADLRFEISVANKKAQRRTLQSACGFVARAAAAGDDHQRKPLLASSPHDAAHVPLVRHDKPIPLGSFQVVRAAKGWQEGVDLSVIRVRYTPPKGEVYGPPTAVAAVASPLPEGQNLVWSRTMQGRMHQIVKPENRILNGDSAWAQYKLDEPGQVDPQPNDSYDGAKNGDQVSWGVVDDTCDGVIQAHLVIDGERFSAFARVTASPPDYAPDRRTFYSVADDLADRDLRSAPPPALGEVADDMVDLLTRVFETATQINLDAERHHYVCRKEPGSPEAPHIDSKSMTSADHPYAKRPALGMIDEQQARDHADRPQASLQYTKMAEEVHEGLMQRIPLLSLLTAEHERVRKLIRPPFGRLHQLAGAPQGVDPDFRDPRVARHLKHDMRMPPYMVDSDANPLSLSWRQYCQLMHLVAELHRLSVAAVQPPALPQILASRPPKVRIHNVDFVMTGCNGRLAQR